MADIETGSQEAGSADLEKRAACLVNPASGIANDYLNHFNEVLLLIENLPTLLPEMLDELLEWRPVTYREYFAKSLLPGSARALEIYEGLDESFRREFEGIIAQKHVVVWPKRFAAELVKWCSMSFGEERLAMLGGVNRLGATFKVRSYWR